MTTQTKTEKREIELTLAEILKLEIEINGLSGIDEKGNKTIIFKGLTSYSLPMKFRYNLNLVLKQCADAKEDFEKLRKELIEKLGVKDENGQDLSITPTIKVEDKDVPNPNYEEFITSIETLLQISRKIEVSNTLVIEDVFEVETTEDYPIIYKILSI